MSQSNTRQVGPLVQGKSMLRASVAAVPISGRAAGHPSEEAVGPVTADGVIDPTGSLDVKEALPAARTRGRQPIADGGLIPVSPFPISPRTNTHSP